MTTPPFDPKYTVYKTVGGSSRIGQNKGCVVDLVNVRFALSAVLPLRLPRKKRAFCRLVLLRPGRFAKRLHCLRSTSWRDVQADPANERLGACTFLPLWVEPLLLIRGGVNGSRIDSLGIYPK